MFDYWKKQGKKPLFPEVDTWQPEQRKFAGKLLIIGGSKGAFFAAAKAMEAALKMGVGEVHVVLPDSLKGQVPPVPEIYFAKAEASGAFGKSAMMVLVDQLRWAESVLIAGDLGKNAETSVAFARFMKFCEKPVWMTRDAVDVLTPDSMNWSMRDESTTVFCSLPQLQKLLRTLYYPKAITLSMPMNQLVETLHKFTLSYSLTIVVFHENQIVIAQDGEVVAQDLAATKYNNLTLWDGSLIAQMATLALWNKKLENYKSASRALLELD